MSVKISSLLLLVSVALVMGDTELKQEQYKECQQDNCFDVFQRQQRQEGSGEGGRGGRGREKEQEEEEEGERDPFVFDEQDFTAQLKGEAGTIRILQKFTERSKLLHGIENFRVSMLEADPHSFVVPHHVDADIIYYVAQGRGTFSVIHTGTRESFNIKRGDVFFTPAGITTYMTNTDSNQTLVLTKILRPVSIPGNFEFFYAAGGVNPESFYRSFSPELLEAAFNTKRDTFERIFRQQRKGVIVKASDDQIRDLSRHGEVGIWPFEGELKGVFNLLEQPTVSNQYGRVHLAYLDDVLSLLEDVHVRVGFLNITQGGMVGPDYHYSATKISIVLNGEGYFEMVCPHVTQQSSSRGSTTTTTGPTYRKVSSRLRRGMVFIVPPGYPTAIVASHNQNLEIFEFVNAKIDNGDILVGKTNVVSQFERAAMELAFGVPYRQVEEVFSSQEEFMFFKGPRHQGRNEM